MINAVREDDSVIAGYTGDDSDDGRYSHSPRSWLPSNRDISETPTAFTGSYTWERNARRMSALSGANSVSFIRN